MEWGVLLYLGVTGGLFAIFAVIVVRAYSAKNKDHIESPKHRMLEEDSEEEQP